MVSAVVVGSGPNGLAAAITLAQAGVDVTVAESAAAPGGGMRSEESTVPGLIHDMCSAVHPMAHAAPFFRSLDLHKYGLQWKWPQIELAHPLAGDEAALLYRDVETTVAGLGDIGWRRLVEPFVSRADSVLATILQPSAQMPAELGAMMRFGLHAMQSAEAATRRFAGERARALFAGIAAHSFRPLTSPGTAGLGLVLAIAAHARGWPVAQGGSQAICDAMLAELKAHGGRVECGRLVRTLPDADLVFLDTSVSAALAIAADRVNWWVRPALQQWQLGPAAFKLDLAVEGGVPWRNPAVGRAGTVHVGGDFQQIAAAESAVNRGRMPARPFVLVGQQYVADPARSAGDVHPVWVYGHVPYGIAGDVSESILAQVERFAPGFRDRIVATAARGPGELQAHNPNFHGGDISTGANTLRQIVFRPRPGLNPYRIGAGIYMCSAATYPGPGVHGMGGFNAARAALKTLQL